MVVNLIMGDQDMKPCCAKETLEPSLQTDQETWNTNIIRVLCCVHWTVEDINHKRLWTVLYPIYIEKQIIKIIVDESSFFACHCFDIAWFWVFLSFKKPDISWVWMAAKKDRRSVWKAIQKECHRFQSQFCCKPSVILQTFPPHHQIPISFWMNLLSIAFLVNFQTACRIMRSNYVYLDPKTRAKNSKFDSQSPWWW